ncbi:biliverdin-producing heme oxygenase [Sphingopyxis sp. RIFCSPHIGHO2_12_FULL_65_19]|uniref:biliverdin-producing heme oxygenase n=1 Tax=Sphingopyxis sp. RIFCSPHIGHO2_12_FULL_65_19 TaxID=1802172 RepID=UPI0008AD606F|nr:biliverdin-producing heme oxygenase [Sphingopyxis sp. RIFCSPHIGHO2_12_FULL_65_19]OHD09919.1 MAG: hypothetical protein A3E77_11795 [Sphingopyxis sp. RIFCSPHIGHO2_12_FULL_65_19]
MARNPSRAVLRAATADCHRRVDAIYSAAVLGDRGSYGDFLRAQAAAHLPAERALDRAGIATLLDDWPARMRGSLLVRDLSDLGLPVPAPIGGLDIATRAEMLGALYVLEGSRLGGAMLKRAVPPHFPARFLGGGGAGSWQSLLALLDRALDTAARQGEAIDAARRAFALFEDGGRRFLNLASDRRARVAHMTDAPPVI